MCDGNGPFSRDERGAALTSSGRPRLCVEGEMRTMCHNLHVLWTANVSKRGLPTQSLDLGVLLTVTCRILAWRVASAAMLARDLFL